MYVGSLADGVYEAGRGGSTGGTCVRCGRLVGWLVGWLASSFLFPVFRFLSARTETVAANNPLHTTQTR